MVSSPVTPAPPTQSPTDVVAPPRGARDWLWIALIANLVGNILIILTGGLVRLTDSGLGCPTWPRCTVGSLVPTGNQAEGFHKFIEFGNRMITPVLVVVALVLLLLAVVQMRGDRRAGRPTRGLFVLECAVPLFFVLVQAVVGGIIVLRHLDPRTVSPHFLISLFLVANGTYLLYRYREGDGPVQVVVPAILQRLAWIAAVVGGVVCVLGTAVTGSGPHSGDSRENVRFGFDPRATSWLHADTVMLFVGLSVAIVVATRLVPVPAPFRRAWDWVLAMSVLQGVIGYVQYFTGRPVAVVAIHLLISALFVVLLTQGVLTARRRGAGVATAPAAAEAGPRPR